MTIHYPAGKIFKAMCAIVGFLVFMDLLVIIIRMNMDVTYIDRTLEIFDVNLENNIPTFYSSISLLYCAVLLLIISFGEKLKNPEQVIYWRILSLGFLYLSIDEMASLHEWMGVLMMGQAKFSGVWHFAWMIPALFMILIIGITFLKFLFRLPVKTRALLLLSGFIYIGGAIGIEMISGIFIEEDAANKLGYELLNLLEESMEMIGILFFVYTLNHYLSSIKVPIEISIEN